MLSPLYFLRETPTCMISFNSLLNHPSFQFNLASYLTNQVSPLPPDAAFSECLPVFDFLAAFDTIGKQLLLKPSIHDILHSWLCITCLASSFISLQDVSSFTFGTICRETIFAPGFCGAQSIMVESGVLATLWTRNRQSRE